MLDDRSAHSDKRVDALVEAAGCRELWLPPYSPGYDPIERANSKVKTLLRKLAKCTVPALLEAIPLALSTFSASDALGYFGHCGNATT